MDKTLIDKLNLLWQGASYQDNLLQSYRNFHLTIQSILIAIGAGLTVAVLSFSNILNAILATIMLLVVSLLGIFLLRKMKNLVKARGEDVDYYHNLIIENERLLPKDFQVMTSFKVYQKFKRTAPQMMEYFSNNEISEDIIGQLTEKGKGHTRRVLDSELFKRFWFIWLSFYVIAIGKTLYICFF